MSAAPKPSGAPALAEIEAWMRWVITEPDGVSTALLRPEERFFDEPEPSCLPVVRETPGFPVRERLDVYAEGYYIRIYHSLAEDFQAVQRWMGDESFRSFLSDYLLEHPSRSPELLEVGARVPECLSSWLEPGEDQFLPDLARLEWACAFAYFAENPKLWDVEAIGRKSPDELALLKLELAPATALVESAWAIAGLRSKLREAAWSEETPKPRPPTRERQFNVVYRDGLWPKSVEVSEAEFQLLRAAQQGLTLGAACERLSEFGEVTPDTLFGWLSKWAARGALAAH